MNLGPQTVSSTYQFVLNQSGNSITLGNGDAVNWDAAGVVITTGNQNISGYKTFKSTIIVEDDVYLGNYAVNNNFGYGATNNDFGSNSTYNVFGVKSIPDYNTTNEFGTNYFQESGGISNYFGSSCEYNDFGSSATRNDFGQGAALNIFGSEIGTNSCIGTFIIQNTGRIRLANFDGLSSQSGLRGEARVSGTYLYICTGASSGWGRIQLQTFI